MGRHLKLEEGSGLFETFCLALAHGRGQAAAAVAVGYKEGNSATTAGAKFAAREDVQRRVAELREQIREQTRQAIVVRAPTRENVLNDLLLCRDQAKETGQLAVRIKANELIGKELGMFVNRVEGRMDGRMEVSVVDTLPRADVLAFISAIRSGTVIEGGFIEIPDQIEEETSTNMMDDRDNDPMA